MVTKGDGWSRMKKYIEFCDTGIDVYVSAVDALKLMELSYEIVEEVEDN